MLLLVLVGAAILAYSATIGSVPFALDGLTAFAEKGSNDEDNSGPGSGSGNDRDDDDNDNDDRESRISSLLAAPQDISAVTTITIPFDAESHSAVNPYSPNPATVSSGSTVTWINADEEDQHSATADDGSFSTGILNPGQSGKAVISAEPGATIPYHCDIHPEMIGLLRVSESTETSAPRNTTTSSQSQFNNPLLSISEMPLADGNFSNLSRGFGGNESQILTTGSMIITLPNSTEAISTNGSGNFTLTADSTKKIREGNIHLKTLDGAEDATVSLLEFSNNNTTGLGIASISTNSAGKLAPLDGKIAITVRSAQPDGSTRLTFFEWEASPTTSQDTNSSNQTNTDRNGTTVPPAIGGKAVTVSIMQGAISQSGDAFNPSQVQVKAGDTVRWTNNDSVPHTVTSGASSQPDGKFNSSPNLSPLMATGQTFEHAFDQAGQYPYYCALHPNMVGTVSVS
jgi:plastocyanin